MKDNNLKAFAEKTPEEIANEEMQYQIGVRMQELTMQNATSKSLINAAVFYSYYLQAKMLLSENRLSEKVIEMLPDNKEINTQKDLSAFLALQNDANNLKALSAPYFLFLSHSNEMKHSVNALPAADRYFGSHEPAKYAYTLASLYMDNGGEITELHKQYPTLFQIIPLQFDKIDALPDFRWMANNADGTKSVIIPYSGYTFYDDGENGTMKNLFAPHTKTSFIEFLLNTPERFDFYDYLGMYIVNQEDPSHVWGESAQDQKFSHFSVIDLEHAQTGDIFVKIPKNYSELPYTALYNDSEIGIFHDIKHDQSNNKILKVIGATINEKANGILSQEYPVAQLTDESIIFFLRVDQEYAQYIQFGELGNTPISLENIAAMVDTELQLSDGPISS